MDVLSAFADVLLPVVVVVGLGYLLGRGLPLDIRTLNRLSLYLLSPSLVFVTLVRTEVAGGAALRLAAQMLIVMLATTLCAFLIAPLLGLSGPRRSGFLLTSTFMNSGNFGLSVSRFAFGEAGFQLAVIGYLTQAILSQTLAVYLASAGQATRRAALGAIFRIPLVYATLLALGLRVLGIHLDEGEGALAVGLYRGLRLAADATLPLLLIILGTQLTRRPSVTAVGPLVAATFIRLVLSIPLAYAIGLALGLRGLPLSVGVVQAAMPTAVNMTIIAIEFDAWPDFVSSGVVATTLGSLVSLAVLIALVR
jgi:malate permease and related proteins